MCIRDRECTLDGQLLLDIPPLCLPFLSTPIRPVHAEESRVAIHARRNLHATPQAPADTALRGDNHIPVDARPAPA